MKLFKVPSVILAVLMLLSCVSGVVVAEETNDNHPQNALNCRTLDAQSSYLGADKITDNVGSVVLYEPKSDTMMYSLEPDTRRFPSSLVKILTAHIAIEQGNLDDVVTISQNVLDSVPYYAASAELVADEQMKLSDLIYCMMVGSANDAAAAIATHISGSQEAFVALMNDYAEKLGCSDTHFVNVHGLHDEQQYTTARDMAKILAAAVNNADFLTFFSAATYVVPQTNKSEERELISGNHMTHTNSMEIYFDERVVGGRTGVTEEGLRCLATLSENNGMQLVCIVMDSKSTEDDYGHTVVYGSFKETSALLDAGFNGFRVVQTLYEGQALKQYAVSNGVNDLVVGPSTSAFSVLPEGTKSTDLSYRFADIENLAAPILPGQVVSSVEVWHGNLCVGQADLVSLNEVRATVEESVPVEQKIETPKKNSNFTWIVIAVIVIVAIAILFVMYFVKRVQMRAQINRTREFRRSRRRSR